MSIATSGAGHDIAGQDVATGLKVDVSKVVAMQPVGGAGHDITGQDVATGLKVDVSKVVAMQPVGGAGHDIARQDVAAGLKVDVSKVVPMQPVGGAGHDIAGQDVAAGLKVDVSKVVAMQPVEDIGKPAEDIGNKDARNVDVSREEEQPFGLSWNNWVKPLGLKDIHCIKRCLQKGGLGDQTSSTMDLLHAIKSVAIAAGSTVVLDMGPYHLEASDGTKRDFPTEQGPTNKAAGQYCSIEGTFMQTEKSPADFRATDDGNAPNPPEKVPYASHPRPDTAGASSAQHLDRNTEAAKWKDVLMPFPFKVQSCDTVFKGAFPKPKVLVLDMNGALMRRFPYPELAPKCPQSCYIGPRFISVLAIWAPHALSRVMRMNLFKHAVRCSIYVYG